MAEVRVMPAPSDVQRLAARERPTGSPVMYQEWRDLLFLHWEFPVETLQRTLPEGLFVDTCEGRAYLGVVPFFMQNIRPRFLPALPGVSNFMELNVRTYVFDRAGVPGVWFYSLEANQWLAVQVARRFFHLPYHRARMSAIRSPAGAIQYQSVRLRSHDPKAACRFTYSPAGQTPAPAPLGALEFFLIERYQLYASTPRGLCRGAVFHPPYLLQAAQLDEWNETLQQLNGFAATARPPDHAIMSPGVDVEIFPLQTA